MDNKNYILDDAGKVVAYRTPKGRIYPYKWDKRYNCYTSISGECTLKNLKARERRGAVRWSS